MFTEDQLVEILTTRFPDSYQLRREFPDLEYHLRGIFTGEPFNVYKQKGGIVVSRTLTQGLPKNPTVGVISPGEYQFQTGNNTETMIVLDGQLFAGVLKPGEKVLSTNRESMLHPYGGIIAPAGTILDLDARSLVFYLCMYQPRRQ